MEDAHSFVLVGAPLSTRATCRVLTSAAQRGKKVYCFSDYADHEELSTDYFQRHGGVRGLRGQSALVRHT